MSKLAFEGDIVTFENSDHYPGSVTFDGQTLTYKSEDRGSIVWTPPEKTLQQLLQMNKEERDDDLELALGSFLHNMVNGAGVSFNSINRRFDVEAWEAQRGITTMM